MTVLTFIAIVPIIVILTLLICASATRNEGPAMAAVILVFLYGVFSSGFQIGSKWQRAYTLDNYTLTPITGKEPTE